MFLLFWSLPSRGVHTAQGRAVGPHLPPFSLSLDWVFKTPSFDGAVGPHPLPKMFKDVSDTSMPPTLWVKSFSILKFILFLFYSLVNFFLNSKTVSKQSRLLLDIIPCTRQLPPPCNAVFKWNLLVIKYIWTRPLFCHY